MDSPTLHGQVVALWSREGQRYAMTLPWSSVSYKGVLGQTFEECRRVLLERVNQLDGAPPSSDYRRGDVLLVFVESPDGAQAIESLLDTIGVVRPAVIVGR